MVYLTLELVEEACVAACLLFLFERSLIHTPLVICGNRRKKKEKLITVKQNTRFGGSK